MTPGQAKLKRWRLDPVSMVVEEFKVTPDKWQVQALRAFADPKQNHISLQACAGPGKSAVLAWFGWNFLLCYADIGAHPNGAAMSVTSDNLKDNLWKELAVWQGRSKLLQSTFTWTKERIFANDHAADWFLSARSWSKNANPEEQGRTLSGLHSKYILYLIDESGDITPAVLRSAEQGLSNCSWGKICQAGNPTSQAGMLYLAANAQRHMWTVIPVSGDPEDPARSTRVSIEWAVEQIKLYGRENPWVMAYILGQFPNTAINALLSIQEVEEAMKRHLREDQYSFSQKRLGIDAARFGDDPWVIQPRQGLAAFMPKVMRGPRSHEVAAVIMKCKEDWGSELELFDDTGGFASGAIDAMILAGKAPVPVNFSSKPIDPRYFNRRSEMWFMMAEWVKRGGALPFIPELVGELTTPKYWFDKGKFRLEEKDQIKSRLGRSPNHGDALALTFGLPDMPAAGPYAHLMQAPQVAHEWNPYADTVNESDRQRVLTDFDPFK